MASRALELTLTSRSKDASGGAIPMCGLPYHALDTYLPRLVRKGYRVAICEQVEDPRRAKGVVKREVVRVFSPGTLLDAGYLDAREPSFLLAIAPGADRTGVALLDLSTGEFTTAEYVGADRWQALNDELAVLRPREIVAPADAPLAEHLPAIAQRVAAGDRPRAVALRARERAPHAARPAAHPRARGLRSRHARCRGLRGGGPRPLPARHAEGRSRARPRHHLQAGVRGPADRSGHARAPRGGGVGRPHARRLAARRARPHDHADGRAAAPIVAPAAAGRDRADSRPSRRGRRARVPHDRARQVPRRAQGGARPRAARRARRARRRRPARSRSA